MLTKLVSANPDRVQLFEVIGRVDDASSDKLMVAMNDAIVLGRDRVILDLSGVQYINSAGLRDLVQIWKRIRALGGTLTIANPSAQVQKIMMLVGLDSVFEIYFEPVSNLTQASRDALPVSHRQVCYYS